MKFYWKVQTDGERTAHIVCVLAATTTLKHASIHILCFDFTGHANSQWLHALAAGYSRQPSHHRTHHTKSWPKLLHARQQIHHDFSLFSFMIARLAMWARVQIYLITFHCTNRPKYRRTWIPAIHLFGHRSSDLEWKRGILISCVWCDV